MVDIGLLWGPFRAPIHEEIYISNLITAERHFTVFCMSIYRSPIKYLKY